MERSAAKVLPSDQLSLKDRLSRLSFKNACKLLGEQGQKLIQSNANTWTISIQDDVYLGDDLLRVRFPAEQGSATPIVTITLKADARQRLHYHCNRCQTVCNHIGATFSLILEEKTALGLAEAPPAREPVESLTDDDLVEQAMAERGRVNEPRK